MARGGWWVGPLDGVCPWRKPHSSALGLGEPWCPSAGPHVRSPCYCLWLLLGVNLLRYHCASLIPSLSPVPIPLPSLLLVSLAKHRLFSFIFSLSNTEINKSLHFNSLINHLGSLTTGSGLGLTEHSKSNPSPACEGGFACVGGKL